MKIPEPDFTFDCITEITPAWLKLNGFVTVLMDLDGTLLPKKADRISEKVVKWLHEMEKNRIFLGVISNSKKERIKSAVDVMEQYIIPFVAKAHKPSGLGIKYMMEEFGLNPESTIYVGDKKKDIIAAHCAGIKSVKVKTMKKGETT